MAAEQPILQASPNRGDSSKETKSATTNHLCGIRLTVLTPFTWASIEEQSDAIPKLGSQ